MSNIYEQTYILTGLYYRRTDGGAEYLCKEHIKFEEHDFIGDIATAVLRLDGGVEILKLGADIAREGGKQTNRDN